MEFIKTNLWEINQLLENVFGLKNLKISFIKIKWDYIKLVDENWKLYFIDVYHGANIFENKKSDVTLLTSEPKNLEFKSGWMIEKILKQKISKFENMDVTHQDDVITLTSDWEEVFEFNIYVNKCEIVNENFIFIIAQFKNNKNLKIYDLKEKQMFDIGSYNWKIEYIEAFWNLVAFRVRDWEFSKILVYDPENLKKTKNFWNILYQENNIKSIVPYEKENQIIFLWTDNNLYKLEIK